MSNPWSIFLTQAPNHWSRKLDPDPKPTSFTLKILIRLKARRPSSLWKKTLNLDPMAPTKTKTQPVLTNVGLSTRVSTFNSKDLTNLVWSEAFGRLFVHFPLVSNMFPSSQWVPQHVLSIAPHFYPICLGKCFPPFTFIAGPKRRNPLFWGASIEFHFFGVMPVGSGFKVGSVLDPYVRQFYAQVGKNLGLKVCFKKLTYLVLFVLSPLK